jgi:hypothetical protein
LTKWVLAWFPMRAVWWVFVSPPKPQLSGILQMEFLVCNDIGAAAHVLKTRLEGYFGVLWAELSIWAAQWHFRVFGELVLKQPSQQKLLFLSVPHSCKVLSFAKIPSRHMKVSL